MCHKYSKLQWLSLFLYSLISTLCSLSNSFRLPFYPLVAQSKGATSTQYGIIYGSFTFSLFVMSISVGVIINKFGASKVGVAGVFIMGCSNILCGFLEKINTTSLFIGFSAIIRVFDGFGYSMARNSSIAIISFEFSTNVEMAFAFLQAFFFAGRIIGPVLGGALFELGGFLLSLEVNGVLLFFMGFILLLFPRKNSKNKRAPFMQILKILQIPSTIFGVFIVFGVHMNISFIDSSLGLHLQKLNLSSFEVGLMFLCQGIFSTTSTFVWSKLCKKYDIDLCVSALSGIFLGCSYIVLGPAPYIPFDINIYTSILGLITLGIGQGGAYVSGFSILSKGAEIAGLPKSILTSAIVSSIFTSSMSLGAITGPILGGYLVEVFGFPWASHFFMLYSFALSFFIIICLCFSGDLKTDKKEEIRIGEVEPTNIIDSLENI